MVRIRLKTALGDFAHFGASRVPHVGEYVGWVKLDSERDATFVGGAERVTRVMHLAGGTPSGDVEKDAFEEVAVVWIEPDPSVGLVQL